MIAATHRDQLTSLSTSAMISSATGPGSSGSWRLVGTYTTLEAANQAVSQLAGNGVQATISMIGGLSVIARG